MVVPLRSMLHFKGHSLAFQFLIALEGCSFRTRTSRCHDFHNWSNKSYLPIYENSFII